MAESYPDPAADRTRQPIRNASGTNRLRRGTHDRAGDAVRIASVTQRPAYKDHPLWNAAMALTRASYAAAQRIKDRQPEVAQSLRKASVTVPARIAEALVADADADSDANANANANANPNADAEAGGCGGEHTSEQQEAGAGAGGNRREEHVLAARGALAELARQARISKDPEAAALAREADALERSVHFELGTGTRASIS
jgi:hypothetical protein